MSAALLMGTVAAWADPAPLSPIATSAAQSPAPWHVVGLPSQTKPFTTFAVTTVDGRRAVRIDADASYGNLVHPLEGKPGEAPGKLAWQWKLETPLDTSDLREKQGDDVALKVCASFDEPLDRVPFVERQLVRYARAQTSEPVPAATVCYIWDTRLAPGTLLASPFTGRLRYIVLQSGNDRVGRWIAEKRDLAADFKRAFGAESPTVPPLVALAVGADADNTKGHSRGFVADVTLEH